MGKKNERPENGACLIFACYLSGRMSSMCAGRFFAIFSLLRAVDDGRFNQLRRLA